MSQIKSIQLGVIAICIATVPLSLAQTPRIRTSGSNQTITTTTAAPIHTGSNGNSIRAPQIGINAGIPTITGATPNIGAHTAINAGVQTGISNQGTGITRAVTGNSVSIGNSLGATQTGINAGSATNIGAHTAISAGAQMGVSNQATEMTGAAMGNGGSSGNSTGATQIGINAATANTKANTNAGAQTGTGTGTGVKTTQPQFFIETTQLPTLSTPTPSPTSTPTATPTASLAPATSASVSPSPTPLL
jgi:hypothetical protein